MFVHRMPGGGGGQKSTISFETQRAPSLLRNIVGIGVPGKLCTSLLYVQPASKRWLGKNGYSVFSKGLETTWPDVCM